jgi:hypothetical protein
MKGLIKQLLRENLQLADKVYFNSGKLSPRVREIITHVTNGDPYTKIMTDIYYTMLMDGHRTGNWALKQLDPEHQETEKPENDVMNIDDLKKLRPLYNQLKEYNKNVFPIKGFNINGVQNTNDLIRALIQREKILNIFNEWPSIAKRNMKGDIKTERDSSEMNHYRDMLESADGYLSQLNNRNEEARRSILAKIFTSNTTLDNVMDFLYNKESLLGGVDMTRKQIGQILKQDKQNADELKVKYNKGNVMIIEVSGPEGIKEIGCNSLWCFTYNRKGGTTNWDDWYKNSTNGYCYIIIDFSYPSDSEDFMHVLTKPLMYDYSDYGGDAERLYNMANRDMGDNSYEDEIYDSYINRMIETYLDLPTAMKIMNFGVKQPKEKKKKQKFVDPNQLSLELNEIKNTLREGLITEAIYNIDDDVDLIYDNFFKDDLEDLLKTRKLNFGMFYNMVTYTNILKNPLCVKANEINPCKILINSGVNFYNPNSNTISVTASKTALEFIKDSNNDLDKALDELNYSDLKKFKSDLSEEKIKGSIHHELTHWLDDTFNNNRLKRAVDRFVKKNKKVGRNNIPIDADTLEIQAQIHNIHQLKRKYQDIWDTLTFNEMMNMSITIRIVYNNLPLKYRDRWVRNLKTRMYREGLLGKKMY